MLMISKCHSDLYTNMNGYNNLVAFIVKMLLRFVSTLSLLVALCSAQVRSASRDSGYIDGVFFSNVVMVTNGKAVPAKFDDFAKHLGFVPTNRTVVNKRELVTTNVTNLCIPQLSTHFSANQYSNDLLGKANAHIRSGYGRPVPHLERSMDCNPNVAQPCEITVSITSETSQTFQAAITDSQSGSITVTIGKGGSELKGDDWSKTITDSLDKSFMNSHTYSEEDSTAHTIGTTITNGWDRGNNTINGGDNQTETIDSYAETMQVPLCKDVNIERDPKTNKIISVKKDGEDMYKCVTERNGNVGVWIFSAGGGESWVDKQQSYTNENANNIRNTTSSSFSDNKSDSYSKASEDATTTTKTTGNSWTKQDTVTVGKSTAINTGKRHDITTSYDNSNAQNNQTEKSAYASNMNTTTESVNVMTKVYVEPGSCMAWVCYPILDTAIVPFLCTNTNGIYQYRSTTVGLPQINFGSGVEICSTAYCSEILSGHIPPPKQFYIDGAVTIANTLKSNRFLAKTQKLTSSNGGRYELKLNANGNLELTDGSTLVWQSNSGYVPVLPSGSTDVRMRINNKGHLIIEATNFFAKSLNYRTGQYITIWSTMPMHQNVTVGTSKTLGDTTEQYMLNLNDKGQLTIFDAYAVPIWYAMDDGYGPYKHMYGYPFPENYMVPTAISFTNTIQDETDLHNIPDQTIVLTNNKLSSLDNCHKRLVSGNGFVSTNGRFALSLDKYGSLTLRDNGRVMWESYTSDISNTRTYNLFISNEGVLFIRDETYRLVWFSMSREGVAPFEMQVFDEGRFAVIDAKNTTVWESWPMNNMSSTVIPKADTKFCYEMCDECPKAVDVNTTTTLLPTSTTAEFTITTTTSTIATMPPIPTIPPPVSTKIDIRDECNKMMIEYKINPFVNGYGSMNASTIWLADRYQCGCFWLTIKYKMLPFESWGTLKDKTLINKWNEYSCPCFITQQLYKIVPVPKSWGSLKDATIKSEYTKYSCDKLINIEPFIVNPINSTTTTANYSTYTITTSNYTTNVATNTGTVTNTRIYDQITTILPKAIVTNHITELSPTVMINRTTSITNGITYLPTITRVP